LKWFFTAHEKRRTKLINGLRRVEWRFAPAKSPYDFADLHGGRNQTLLAGCLRGMIENGNVPNNPPWGPSMFLNGYSSNSK
jgi:hypothetical protein